MAFVRACHTRDLAGQDLAPDESPSPEGFILPLKMRPGHFQGHEARALLVNGTLPLHGAVKDLG